jgi:hypothetical protein
MSVPMERAGKGNGRSGIEVVAAVKAVLKGLMESFVLRVAPEDARYLP